jgi:hypothetical protein
MDAERDAARRVSPNDLVFQNLGGLTIQLVCERVDESHVLGQMLLGTFAKSLANSFCHEGRSILGNGINLGREILGKLYGD